MRWLVLAVMCLASTASAHQSSVKYVDLVLDGARADITIKVAPGDVSEPMKLAPDAKPAAPVAAASPAVPAYVQRWLVVRVGDIACTATPARASADADNFVAVAWSVTCPQTIDRFTLDFAAFFALDKRMEAIVRVSRARGDVDDVTPIVVRAGSSPITLRAGESSLASWFVAGLLHVLGGADHVCFVLALLLVVMLERERARVNAAGVIVAFTLAHSVTLFAAAFGWIVLPVRLVGSLVAATIVYTAAEDLVRPPGDAVQWRWRFALAFVFGLAHGTLGFTLGEHALAPIACFDLGALVGQLAIAGIALVACYGVAKLLGAERYRRYAVPIASALIFVVGCTWLLQRVFDM